MSKSHCKKYSRKHLKNNTRKYLKFRKCRNNKTLRPLGGGGGVSSALRRRHSKRSIPSRRSHTSSRARSPVRSPARSPKSPLTKDSVVNKLRTAYAAEPKNYLTLHAALLDAINFNKENPSVGILYSGVYNEAHKNWKRFRDSHERHQNALKQLQDVEKQIMSLPANRNLNVRASKPDAAMAMATRAISSDVIAEQNRLKKQRRMLKRKAWILRQEVERLEPWDGSKNYDTQYWKTNISENAPLWADAEIIDGDNE
jgi:hypothetical protein